MRYISLSILIAALASNLACSPSSGGGGSAENKTKMISSCETFVKNVKKFENLAENNDPQMNYREVLTDLTSTGSNFQDYPEIFFEDLTSAQSIAKKKEDPESNLSKQINCSKLTVKIENSDAKIDKVSEDSLTFSINAADQKTEPGVKISGNYTLSFSFKNIDNDAIEISIVTDVDLKIDSAQMKKDIKGTSKVTSRLKWALTLEGSEEVNVSVIELLPAATQLPQNIIDKAKASTNRKVVFTVEELKAIQAAQAKVPEDQRKLGAE